MINLIQISFNYLKIFLFIITLFFYCQASLSEENKIIFKINDKAFTTLDYQKRKQYLEFVGNNSGLSKDFIINDFISSNLFFEYYTKSNFKLKLEEIQVFENINALLDTEYDFKKYFNSKEIIQDFNITGKSLEGYLYPDTYYLYHDSSPGEIIEILLSEFWKQFDKNLIDRTNQLGFSVHQVVTLASIIEGEAMLSSERKTISSVYHNRLKINMKLQADPTIQYIIPGPPKTLSIRDLRIKSEYNTYQNYGLPPGPINNPGIESIKAALYPEDTNFLFFVAQGDGSHAFTTNEKDHEEAKRIYKINKRKNR